MECLEIMMRDSQTAGQSPCRNISGGSLRLKAQSQAQIPEFQDISRYFNRSLTRFTVQPHCTQGFLLVLVGPLKVSEDFGLLILIRDRFIQVMSV